MAGTSIRNRSDPCATDHPEFRRAPFPVFLYQARHPRGRGEAQTNSEESMETARAILGAALLLALLCAPSWAQDAGSGYTIDEQGIITSAETGLQWHVGPANVTWDQAVAFCQDLDLDGGNWRMPTVAELQGLFTGQENWKEHCSLPPVFQGGELSINWVWANETKNAQEAFYVYFYNGLKAWDDKEYVDGAFRVFAVRAQ